MDRQYLDGARSIAREICVGWIKLARNGLAVVGLAVVCAGVLMFSREDGVSKVSQYLARTVFVEDASGSFLPVSLAALAGRLSEHTGQFGVLLGLNSDEPANEVTKVAVNDTDRDLSRPRLLQVDMPPVSKEQQAVSRYLVRKYRVNQVAVNLLVTAAWDAGRELALDPKLLLAVMAMESGFNPFAESVMGAQGLMQVMSSVHRDKLEPFGGAHAALNPVVNLKVGALILKDCIRRGGSVEDGLRLYVGATTNYDGVYGARVMAEQGRIAAAARSAVSERPQLKT